MLAQVQKPDKWIVVDNSTSPDHDWSVSKELACVDYHTASSGMSIGNLRNMCLELALKEGADYIVFWDDDDYYPPERIACGVEALENNPEADIAASSHMYVLLTNENVFMEVGPFHKKHGTAATYTIRRRYAESNRFPDKSRGEELEFTNGWNANMIQVSAEKTIVVMGHSRNTVNKSQIYNTPHLFQAKLTNEVNGKMILRTRWPVPWNQFRSTFVDGEYVRLRENTPESLNHSVTGLIRHTEETAACGEHRV